MKKVLVLLIVALFVVGMVAPAFAAEKKSFKEATKDAGKASVNYPANVVKNSAQAVVDTTKAAVDTVSGTVQATGDTLTGQPDRAKDIVVTPVTGTAETAKTAIEGVGTAPVKAAEETKEQM